jgi:PQQ-dependent catabolism-associated CXXCW motif protein
MQLATAVAVAQTPAVVQPVITPSQPTSPSAGAAAPIPSPPLPPVYPKPIQKTPPPANTALTVPNPPPPAAPQPAWWHVALEYQSYDSETQNFGVPPIAVIRVNNYEGPTPTVITGARTITTPQLRDLLASPHPPLLIDVLGGDPDTSLPGAILFSQAGFGYGFNDEVEQRLARHLAQLTHGNYAAPMVFFCLSKTCWLSHNAAVRAVSLGYTNVMWYRGGRNAWMSAGLPMEPVFATPF